MNTSRALAIVSALGLLTCGSLVAQAEEPAGSNAEKLRRLDIMLMVTALRCRTTTDSFMNEYGAFTNAHMTALNRASAELQKGLTTQNGPFGASRALDRISVIMANKYGQGHPWLSCAQLKSTAAVLATVEGPAQLTMAADQLLADARPADFSLPEE